MDTLIITIASEDCIRSFSERVGVDVLDRIRLAGTEKLRSRLRFRLGRGGAGGFSLSDLSGDFSSTVANDASDDGS